MARFIVKHDTFNRKKDVTGMQRTIIVSFFIEFFRATTFFFELKHACFTHILKFNMQKTYSFLQLLLEI